MKRLLLQGTIKSVNLLLDMSEPETHPLINTDYRIGALEINYLHELDLGFIQNAGLKVIPYFHESSHLGDELMVYRIDAGFPIPRLNPTGNTAELSFVINDENGSQTNNHSFKLGTRIAWSKKYGFYSIREEEGDTSLVIQSENRFEWYLQYQWNGPSGFIKSQKVSTVLSLELRNRVRYNYPYYIEQLSSTGLVEINPDQKYVPSLNGYLGWRYRILDERASYLGLYCRFYVGVNPYGQFRNIPVHRVYGLSMGYEN